MADEKFFERSYAVAFTVNVVVPNGRDTSTLVGVERVICVEAPEASTEPKST